MIPIAADPADSHPASPAASPHGGDQDDQKLVLKEGKRIGETYYLLELSTDGRALTVSAYDGASQTSLELIIKEKKHRQLYRECNGDYSLMASRLSVDNNRLVINSPG